MRERPDVLISTRIDTRFLSRQHPHADQQRTATVWIRARRRWGGLRGWWRRSHVIGLCHQATDIRRVDRTAGAQKAQMAYLTRRAPAQAQAFATALSRLRHVTVRVLDEVCAFHALSLAAQQGLRGADAIYAAVACEAGSIRGGGQRRSGTRIYRSSQYAAAQQRPDTSAVGSATSTRPPR
jgi:hypothetical protein